MEDVIRKEESVFDEVEVHWRVQARHPELSPEDVESAWRNATVVVERITDSFPDVVLVAVGSDANNRLLEMVATVQESGIVCIFRAMTPPSDKTLRETGLKR